MTNILTLLIIKHTLTLSQFINPNVNNSILPQQNTSTPTLSTSRRLLDCNYGIYYGEDFYETYSIDTCYKVDTFSHQYNCINSTLGEQNYFGSTTCNGTISPIPLAKANYCNDNNNINANIKCNDKPIMINKYNKNQTSSTCDKTYFISQIPIITGYCIQTPIDNNRFVGAIYNEYNPKQLSLIQHEYNTMDQCISEEIPTRTLTILSNGLYCSQWFYYTIETATKLTSTPPTSEPTIEPTIEPTTTTTTPVSQRSEIPCNYVIDTHTVSTDPMDAFPFYVTYPIDQCYITPYYNSPQAQVYECNIDGQSVAKYEWYNSLNCSAQIPADTMQVYDSLDNFLPVCSINNGSTNTDICKFKLVQQYRRPFDSTSCNKDSLRQSIPWILDYCIWVETSTFIYNEYDVFQNTITQYGYNSMENCIKNVEQAGSVTIQSYACWDDDYYYEIEPEQIMSSATTPSPTIQSTGAPTIEPSVSVTNTSSNITMTTTDPSSEPTTEPTGEPTIEPTVAPTRSGSRREINCNYGIYNDELFFETIPINNCYIIPYNSGTIARKYMCSNNGIFETSWSYNGTYDCNNKSIGINDWNINNEIHRQCNITIENNNKCEFKLINRYHKKKELNSCSKSGTNSFNDSIPLIINYCIDILDGSGRCVYNSYNIKNITQYVYRNMNDCINHKPYTNISVNPFKCDDKWYYQLETQIITTQIITTTNEPTTGPTAGPTSSTTQTTTAPVLNTTNALTTQLPSQGELNCNYGTMLPVPMSNDNIYYETLITNKCYAGYDEWESRRFECVNGVMYIYIYYGNTCTEMPAQNYTVQSYPDYAGYVSEHCNYDEINVPVDACDFVWLKQYNAPTECEPKALHKTMAFIEEECIAFGAYFVRNDVQRFENDIAITQYRFDSFDVCNNGGISQTGFKIINRACPQTAPYWQLIIESQTTTTTTPTTTTTTTTTTIQPTENAYELDCNYGVSYTLSSEEVESDFYATYILDTCYNLNVKAKDIEYALKYECDFSFMFDKIDEIVYRNPNGTCDEHINHTNSYFLHDQMNKCDINKIGKQCDYVWLSSFRQYSDGRCIAHPHTIIKYAMIINKCILFENDGTAFKNIYTQSENNRRELIQFQYLNINDCIYDNVTRNNIGVINSIADDTYHFIHNECKNGRYYTVQPANMNPFETTLPAETTTTTTTNVISTEINETTTTTTQFESTTTQETTQQTTSEISETTSTENAMYTTEEMIYTTTTTTTTPSVTTNLCNYMIRADTYMDFYSTILENKCYSHEGGSKKYECMNNKFMVTEWIPDKLCDGIPNDGAKPTQGQSSCIDGNNKLCNTISVYQFNSNSNCTREEFIEEYTFITNICLQYTGHKNNKNEIIYIYNQYDEHNPNEMIQLHFNSVDLCMEFEYGNAFAEDTITINNEECVNGYYYEILINKPSIQPTYILTTVKNETNKSEPYYKKIYKSIFGPEGPTTIEFDVLILAVIIIFGCLCCGILCWCGWLKGCTDICWNVLCCGRYSRLADTPLNNDEDTDDVEMGQVDHRLMPNDNMELAALSEHRDDNDNDNRHQRRRNRKPKKPGKRNRL